MTLNRLVALAVLCIASTLIGCGSSSGNGTTGGTTPPTIPPPATEGAAIAAASFDYNLTALNAVRTARGLPLFTRDGALDTFAMNASRHLLNNHAAHAYFIAFNPGCSAAGFNTACAENQGDPNGWTVLPTNTQIQQIIDAMMAEEGMFPPGDPRRGHFETIVNPAYTRVGIGLIQDTAGRLYFSNEFSN